MLGILPTHAKNNWQKWVVTFTHAYNCTISSVTVQSLFLDVLMNSKDSFRH